MNPAWTPRYKITPAISRALMAIEAVKTLIEHTPLPLALEEALRRRARVRSTHYSTAIEGNRLTLAQAEKAIQKRQTFRGRERDVKEVRNYWQALLRVEAWAADKLLFSEKLIQRLHGLVERGGRPTPFRSEQNVIREGGSGKIVYLPPEAKDVPQLMRELVAWEHAAEREGVPVPIIAALTHYQFVTIHPYFDGNGRTARLLATFLLHRGGYGLNGFLSLEEHHARDLEAYYGSLVTHPHHNYYHGRATADLTSWLSYFTKTLSEVFQAAKDETLRASQKSRPVSSKPEPWRHFDPRARAVLGLFAKAENITASTVKRELGLSERMIRLLLAKWVKEGWLKFANASNRARAYKLSAIYRQYVGALSAMREDGPRDR